MFFSYLILSVNFLSAAAHPAPASSLIVYQIRGERAPNYFFHSIKTLDKLENVFYVCCMYYEGSALPVLLFTQSGCPCPQIPLSQLCTDTTIQLCNYSTTQLLSPFDSRKRIPYFTPRYAAYQGAADRIATYGGEYSFLLRYAERLPNP
jgi:hypothetical protein